MISYGRQKIGRDDIKAVSEVLESDWLTTGPKVDEFEAVICRYVGAEHGVAVSNGTAALHAAMFALGIGPGDEVIVPAITFVATANSVVFCGGHPVFADVERGSLLVDPSSVESKITRKTRAIIAVDYAGQPCNYDRLQPIARKHGLKLVTDGCHALGAEYKGRRVGSIADLTAFSFHPVKHITTGEGGMITTDDGILAAKMRMFRNHGIATDFRQREKKGSWSYEMTELGYNYRITDFQCALGISQMKKQDKWLRRRRVIAARYDREFRDVPGISPLTKRRGSRHAYHLYVVKIEGGDTSGETRAELFAGYRSRGIGVNVHYIPVHLHPFYKRTFGTAEGDCPVAEAEYKKIISLPLHQGMSDADVREVICATKEMLRGQDAVQTQD